MARARPGLGALSTSSSPPTLWGSEGVRKGGERACGTLRGQEGLPSLGTQQPAHGLIGLFLILSLSENMPAGQHFAGWKVLSKCTRLQPGIRSLEHSTLCQFSQKELHLT